MSDETTELREKLNKLIIEIERLDIKLDSPAYGITLGEYEQEREKLLDEFMQAISATLGNGTLTAEQVEKAIHDCSTYASYDGCTYYASGIRLQAIADELNAELGSGKAKDLLLRTFGLAQMMHDCWLEECKAGDNVDVSACNAYSYEFDQIAQAMFDMGTDPNDSDYYRSVELGGGTCHSTTDGSAWCFACSECGKTFPRYELHLAHNHGEINFCPNCGRLVTND